MAAIDPDRSSGGGQRHTHAPLVARAERAAAVRASALFGPGEYLVEGRTERGCCVHVTVRRDGRLLARWRYELDGRIRPE